MLVTIATFTEPQEAHMLRGRLWAEGIFAVVSHTYHVGNNWAWSLALGGAKVQVRRIDYAAAREVERSTRAGECKIGLQHEVGDLDDVDCPKCHSMQFWRRAPVFQGALAIVFSFLAGTVVPPWRRINVCKGCGTEFKERYGLIGKARAFQFPMTIAEATLGDIPEMLELCASADCDIDTIPLGLGRGWLCRIDGAVRGLSFAETDARRLSTLAVDPDFERNGIGRQLHYRAVDWLFANGGGAIRTTCAPYTKGQKFFRAAGWRLVDGEPNGDYLLELDLVSWNRRRDRF